MRGEEGKELKGLLRHKGSPGSRGDNQQPLVPARQTLWANAPKLENPPSTAHRDQEDPERGRVCGLPGLGNVAARGGDCANEKPLAIARYGAADAATRLC